MALIVFAVACGHDGGGDRVAPSPTATVASTPVPTPTPSPAFVAWAVGQRLVSRSDDGGRSWTPVFDTGSAGAFAVDFADRQHGWVVGERIFHTSDGGSDDGWEDQTPNVQGVFSLLFDVAFLDTAHGVAVGGDLGSQPVVLTTSDGGDSWLSATLLDIGPRGEFAAGPSSVCLTATGIGVTVAPANGPEDPLILLADATRTTWTDIRDRVPVGSYRGTACTGTSNLWLVGEEGRVAVSFDAGTSWVDRSIAALPGLALVSAFFADPDTGWVPAFDRTTREVRLYSTNDGGLHWQARVFATDVEILEALPPLAVRFVDQARGLFVGTDPASFDPFDRPRPLSVLTIDGGGSWTAVAVTEEIAGFSDVDVLQ